MLVPILVEMNERVTRLRKFIANPLPGFRIRLGTWSVQAVINAHLQSRARER